MTPIKIEDIEKSSLEDIEGLCIPERISDDPHLIEGSFLWRKWAMKNLDEFSSIGKVAYQDSKIKGMIQYVPKKDQNIVKIKCIFSEEDDLGIRNALLEETIKEFEKPKRSFKGKKAEALITLPCPSPNSMDDIDFYKGYGFKPLNGENILYYPLKDDLAVNRSLNLSDDPPIKETEKDKALILCNSHCPYCVKEMMETFEELKKVDSDMPVKLVVSFDEPERFSPVFSMPLCLVVNGTSIGFSTKDNVDFVKEMNKVLDKEKQH